MAIFVAGEKREKLRGGWTEMQGEQSGRVGEEKLAVVEWSVCRRVRSAE